jgi:hypothetical protein
MEADAHVVRRDTEVSRDVLDRCVLEIDSTQHVGVSLPKPGEHPGHAPTDGVVCGIGGPRFRLSDPSPVGTFPGSHPAQMVDGGVPDETCEPGDGALLRPQCVDSGKRLLEGLLEYLLCLLGVAECTGQHAKQAASRRQNRVERPG